MKLSKDRVQNTIILRKNPKYNHLYDVLLDNVQELKRYSFVECHVVLYPYNRNISSDDIKFNPFEEYVEDIVSEHRSVYIEVPDNTRKIFGFILGLLITLIFARYKPQILISVESVVSIFAAYTFGKEAWNDIHNALVHITRNWRLSYITMYYSYQLERHTTLTRYSNLARRKRLGMTPVLPHLMDFIAQSNSQTLRMKFRAKELYHTNENQVHLFSIQITEDKIQHFANNDFLFGIKLTFSKKYWKISHSIDLFQSLNGEHIGCLDNEEQWIDDRIFYRKNWSFGRINYRRKTGFFTRELIKYEA